MGMGATNTLDRLGASIGCLNGIEPEFKSCADVPNGGVLLALPSLLSQGLLYHIKSYFNLPKGYYSISSIFLLLGFIILVRLKFVESLKYIPPGEWGKLLGLDRVPEAKTLRTKIHHLSEWGQPQQWSAALSKNWMEATPEETGILYVDGHVRVYYGSQTKLPRRYVSRDKLFARTVCEYWVNAMNGQPFFYINKTIDPGLLQVLVQEIIPRLEKDIPKQPTQEQLTANPLLPRFTIICDREGFSPLIMKQLWEEKRIAISTYLKNQTEDWAKEEFFSCSGKFSSGERVDLMLAERGTYLGGKIWVREVRRLKKDNSQGSIVSTNFIFDIASSFLNVVSRWSQENFFGYARREFNLDRLIDYGLEPVSETTKIVNPNYRKINSEIKKLTSLLNRKKIEFGNINFDGDLDSKNAENFAEKKSAVLDEIRDLEERKEKKKQERKDHPSHILFKDLSEEDKFQQLRTSGKHLIDTIKMIAYRAETAMTSIVREKMTCHDPGTTRKLLREIYNSSVDIKVKHDEKEVIVYLHHLANNISDQTAKHLCQELTETETLFPGTDYRMVYELLP
jgi:hypothetical protein